MNSTDPHEITVVMSDVIGFHTRTAALFAQTAAEFSSTIRVRQPDKKEVNAKSTLGLLSLGVKHGTAFTVTASGDDAEKALLALKKLIEMNFSQES